MKAIGIAVALLLAAAGAAEAGDWRYAGSGSGSVFGYDHSSIRTSGTRRTFWMIYIEERTVTVADISFDYAVTRTTVDCSRETNDPLAAAYYLLGGNTPVHSYEDAEPAETILPDSLLAAVMVRVCGQEQPGDTVSATAEEFAQIGRGFLTSEQVE